MICEILTCLALEKTPDLFKDAVKMGSVKIQTEKYLPAKLDHLDSLQKYMRKCTYTGRINTNFWHASYCDYNGDNVHYSLTVRRYLNEKKKQSGGLLISKDAIDLWVMSKGDRSYVMSKEWSIPVNLQYYQNYRKILFVEENGKFYTVKQ